ncbi:MAG: hypothetical protein WAX77_13195 [Methylococcaceae bacterium]
MNKKTLALTLGGAMASVLTASPMVHAQENPFAIQKISGVQLAEADAKTSEGACSANKMKEAKCGEGKCGANKKMKEGGCSGSAKPDDKMKEGGCSNKM